MRNLTVISRDNKRISYHPEEIRDPKRFVDSEEDQDNYFKKRPQPVFINHNYEA
jgi:hypothetical protein